MSTEKQIEANRRNALLSSGPKTDEGKAASRLNAVTHGLTASLTEAVDRSQVDFEERKAKWREELRPETDVEETFFDQLVIESIRVERCQKTFLALCAQHARRARIEWDGDRRRDAATLAVGLPKNPHRVAAELAATPHGCDLMLDLWKGLRASLDRHKTWTDNQRSIALDLLGIHRDLRDASTPVDPAEGDVYQSRLDLVDAEIARLAVVRERTVRLDHSDRELAERSIGAEFTKPVQLLDRYERNAHRRFALAMKALKSSQSGESSETKPIPVVKAPVARVETPPPVAKPLPEPPVSKSIATPVANQTQFDARLAGLNRQQRRKLAALDRRAG